MLHTVEALIDQEGHIHWLEKVKFDGPQRVLITLLDPAVDESLALSEPALAEEWLNSDEEAAWAHLQPEASS